MKPGPIAMGCSSKYIDWNERHWIERRRSAPSDRLYRLTAQGRLFVLGGRDPEQRWERHWDGQWRIVLFYVPLQKNTQRRRLWRYLRDKGFGYLQNSVWVTPDPLQDEGQILRGGKINVESLILLEGRPCAGESDDEIVAGAWDFERINHRYAQHLKVLKQRPTGALRECDEGIATLGSGRARDVAKCDQ
jgi:phenylacetic acid degradation operon negative regulatory protein